jgi:hypothetical protein
MTTSTNLNSILTEALESFTGSEGITPVRKRQPLNGRAQKLEVFGTIPGFHMYIAKDEGARITLMRQAGYELVAATELEGFGAQAYNTDPGGHVRFVLGSKGSGEPLYGYLMKIPEQYWLEDQAALEKANLEIDEQIRKGSVGVTKGSDERRFIKPGEHHYEPGANTTFRSKPT